jgi:hypothetical protein
MRQKWLPGKLSRASWMCSGSTASVPEDLKGVVDGG